MKIQTFNEDQILEKIQRNSRTNQVLMFFVGAIIGFFGVLIFHLLQRVCDLTEEVEMQEKLMKTGFKYLLAAMKNRNITE
ncbi:Oidioi.mRNA.OKI2018_I69.chr1.g2082.t1.cds [Oikopleura dioica]|uniref:Oidioi.mRNA.OKI2018_I69.chr1.g2082.t1.cds n=1 Tax=Oikopleura dioica TaxID=34765 RepID=A0ABN7SPY7_OIKDI|nr:Oidioi.mRNA.OKI2018_I69.chr1.g2082.t1.cds [Oikopleura dioica]